MAVTTNAADTAAIGRWLRQQLPADQVATAAGYYAAVSALAGPARVVVVDIGVPDDRTDWRLAELRGRTAGAAVIVLADRTHVSALAAPLRADLAVTRMRDLPPLRELLLGDDPVAADQATLPPTAR